jgi:hypothetical protein
MTRLSARASARRALLATLVLALPAPASATTLTIQFTGLDLVYAGSLLCDAAGCNASSGTRVDSDPLATMTFGFDDDADGVVDTPVGTLTGAIWADLRLALGSIPAGGGTLPGGAGYLDLLTQDSDPGFGMALSIAEWTATYTPAGGLFFFGSGAVSGIASQDLPFELGAAHLPVEFSFSSRISPGTLAADEEQAHVIGFRASGTGEISSAYTPEPGTASLLGLGLLGLAAGSRRRRAAR